MSEHWPPPSEAQRVPIWSRPPEISAFTPWPTEPARSGGAGSEPAEPIYDFIDPDRIRAESYAEGLAEGRKTVEAETAAERDAIARLAEALEVLQPEPPRALGLLLAETVERLVRQTVGEVTIDGETLLERAHAAAEIIADETAPARMRLHPADLARLEGARLDVEMVADTHLAEGTILIETGDGWIEDSHEVRLEKLRAALDRMGVSR
jgi:flagellar assembly protein FliH